MEFFGARPERPIETCLGEVRRCDIIVVIVGRRYGTLVPGRGISYSEAEYAEGLRLGLPCLVYIRDEVPASTEALDEDSKKMNCSQNGRPLSGRGTLSYRSCKAVSWQSKLLPISRGLSVSKLEKEGRDRESATEPEDRVFTNITGKPAKSLYTSLIADLLNEANLREGTQGVPRSTYCFRHTYATLRLQEGVDVYFLAEQMGTSVHMIEEHYGHVNTIKHADRVLQGMAGWELPHPEVDVTKAKASKAAETHDKSKRGRHRRVG